jgi:fido (protein-threonine AMPylation protein)
MPRHFDLSSFENFRDERSSAFFVAPGLTPEETWREITDGMDLALAEAKKHILSRRPVAPSMVIEFHGLTFESTFPEHAGRLRGFLPNDEPEEVWFGVRVGTSRTAQLRQTKGSHPNRIEENLGRACTQFEDERYEFQRTRGLGVRDAIGSCAKLYAKIANIHPFVDGNLRASFATLQVALGLLELPMVMFPDLEAHDDAMDQALRVDSNQTYSPLTYLVEDIVKKA